jgi:tetratricopeptide (TPR) repeat protein
LPTTDFAFSADRARAAWKDIPVQMAGPYNFVTDLKVILPEGGKGYELRGREVVNTEIAGTTILRDAALEGGVLKVRESVAATLIEVDPAAIGTEKAKAARFGAGKLSVRAPEGTRREWDYTTPADRKLIAPIEAAYAKLIDKDPGKAAPWLARATFRSGVLDWTGALADVDKAIAIAPSAEAWFSRSGLLQQLGRQDESLAAVRSAFELQPTPENALAEAQSMAELGDVAEALKLVDD